MDEMDLTSAESKATYEEIKAYVAEHNDGMKVSSINIAQVKDKYGIIERENFNKPTWLVLSAFYTIINFGFIKNEKERR